MRTLLLLFVLGCGGHGASPIEMPVTIEMDVIKPPPRVVKPVAPPRVVALPTVEFQRSIALRKEPRGDAGLVGIVNKGTRTSVMQSIDGGADCKGGRWVEVAPRGWTCDNAVAPTALPPTAASEDRDEAAPIHGVYGVVRGATPTAYASRDDVVAGEGRVLTGSNTVRAAGTIVVNGRRFWRTTQGQLIDEASIAYISPSRFKGVAIADPAAMPAWVRGHRDAYKPIVTYAAPSLRAAVAGKLEPRAVVTILETDGAFVRVGDAVWMERRDLRVAAVAAPPAGIAAGEKWFDIDRDEQVLVAYEGDRPVYATLVSTGKYQHETPTSIARIATKLEHAVMTSDKESIYSVADVPWTMYYDRDFALHTAYWHDGFGGPRSHGCVNLAPRDARALYRWSSPDVPPGWTAVYGDEDHPGSLVRVRSQRDPEPAYRGYARTMHDRTIASSL